MGHQAGWISGITWTGSGTGWHLSVTDYRLRYFVRDFPIPYMQARADGERPATTRALGRVDFEADVTFLIPDSVVAADITIGDSVLVSFRHNPSDTVFTRCTVTQYEHDSPLDGPIVGRARLVGEILLGAAVTFNGTAVA